MSRQFRYTFFSNWHIMRWVRFVLGIFITYQAVYLQDSISGLIGGFLLFQALTNTGCCGINRECNTSASGKISSKIATEEIEFEEIKEK